MSPAEIEPAGVLRHRRSPKGERAGKSESIEPTRRVATKLANLLARGAMSPAAMEPLGSERHGQSPQSRSAGALRSIEPSCGPITKLPTIWHIAECPRRESNPHLRFRKPPFFPLNYGDYKSRKIHGLKEGEQVAPDDPPFIDLDTRERY